MVMSIEIPKLGVEENDKGRFYITPSGHRYPSITTMLGKLNERKFLQWEEAVGVDEANRVKRHASARGTIVHSLIEDYINGTDINHRKLMPHQLQGFNAIRKSLDFSLGKVLLQEKAIYSDFLRLAGRVDCIAEFDGKLSIIDFKTSNKPKSLEDISSYFIQCAFYSAALYERTRKEAKQLVIIMAVDYEQDPLVFIEPFEKWFPKMVEARNDYTRLTGL